MIKALTMNIQESYQPMLPLSPRPDSSLEISPNKKRSIPGNDYGDSIKDIIWDLGNETSIQL